MKFSQQGGLCCQNKTKNTNLEDLVMTLSERVFGSSGGNSHDRAIRAKYFQRHGITLRHREIPAQANATTASSIAIVPPRLIRPDITISRAQDACAVIPPAKKKFGLVNRTFHRLGQIVAHPWDNLIRSYSTRSGGGRHQ